MSSQPPMSGSTEGPAAKAIEDESAIASSSPLSPLKRRLFAMLWLATLASNVGTWMNDVGAGWLMTTLSSGPTAVALVQTATILPCTSKL